MTSMLQWQIRFESYHIYLWIIKDYSWASDSYYLALTFGISTVVWNYLIMILCLIRCDFEGFYMQVATACWLGGNFVWMLGEVNVPGTNGVVIEGNDESNTLIALYCFIASLTMMVLYFCVLIVSDVFHARTCQQKSI